MAGSSWTTLTEEQEMIENAWVLETAARRTLERIDHTHSLDRDFLQGVLYLPIEGNQQNELNRLLICFLCAINESDESLEFQERYTDIAGSEVGENEVEKDDTEEVTELENAALMFASLVKKFGSKEDGYTEKERELLLELYKQAILTCCRLDQFDTASDVYKRTLNCQEFAVGSRQLRKRIQSVVKSRATSHQYLAENPFNRVQDLAAEYLRPLCSHLQETFLGKLARRVQSGTDVNNELSIISGVAHEDIDTSDVGEPTSVPDSTLDSDIVKGPQLTKVLEQWQIEEADRDKWKQVTPALNRRRQQIISQKAQLKKNMPEVLKSMQQRAGDEAKTASPSKGRRVAEANGVRLKGMAEKLQDAGRQLDAAMNNMRKNHRRVADSDEEEDELEQNGESDSPKASSKHRNRKRQRSSREDEENDDDDFDFVYPKLPTPRKQRTDRYRPDADNISVSSFGQKRKTWTAFEEEALFLAVREYGVGNWREIKDNCTSFPWRSNVDLKDKWRNMTKSGRLEELKDLKSG